VFAVESADTHRRCCLVIRTGGEGVRMIAINEEPRTLSDLEGFEDWVADVMAALAGTPAVVEVQEEERDAA
jgi:hypothetical protein